MWWKSPAKKSTKSHRIAEGAMLDYSLVRVKPGMCRDYPRAVLVQVAPTPSCPKTRTNSGPASAGAFRIDASTLASPREAGMLGHEHADPTLGRSWSSQ